MGTAAWSLRWLRCLCWRLRHREPFHRRRGRLPCHCGRLRRRGRVCLGRVQLAGKSVGAANAEITAAFANGYLINPGIALNIVSYGEYQTVSVQGKVRQPGAVSFRKGEWIDALRAIQRAGGLTDPKVRKVVLQRSGALESVGDIAMMLDGKQARMTLRDGDLLVVGE